MGIFQAEREKCFERKRTKFNACDFLTEWLYNRNPKHPERMESPQSILEIPFCRESARSLASIPTPLRRTSGDDHSVSLARILRSAATGSGGAANVAARVGRNEP